MVSKNTSLSILSGVILLYSLYLIYQLVTIFFFILDPHLSKDVLNECTKTLKTSADVCLQIVKNNYIGVAFTTGIFLIILLLIVWKGIPALKKRHMKLSEEKKV